MYASGYNKLFWGMIFIIFNINLGPINILPNFVGYLFIYSGLNLLSSQHIIYEKGKVPSIILTVLTLKDIINPGNVNVFDNISQINYLSTALSLSITIFDIYLIYIICRGIYLLADERGLGELKETARGRFKAYLIITIIFQFYLSFSMNLPYELKMGMFIFLIINIIIMLMITGLFKKAENQLGE